MARSVMVATIGPIAYDGVMGNTHSLRQEERETTWVFATRFDDLPIGSVIYERAEKTYVKDEPGEASVTHRGWVYPEHFEATFTRQEDGLQVILEVAVDESRGPTPVSVTITAPDGVAGKYRQPIHSMVRTAARNVGFRIREPEYGGQGHRQPWPSESVPMGPAPIRTDTERLKHVADLYQQAIDEGEPVGEYIAAEQYVSHKTAYGLIRRARKAGLLPPSPPGRKTRADE